MQADVGLLTGLCSSQPHHPVHPEPSVIPALPEYPAMGPCRFNLGSLTGEVTVATIADSYNQAVHYRPNAFMVPSGNTGREFIKQLTKYLECFGHSRPYESHALKIAMVYQMLLLQKPYKCTNSSFSKCLQHRMVLWKQGKLDELLHECQTIHNQLNKHQIRQRSRQPDPAQSFATLITKGKIHSALDQLTDGQSGCVLHSDEKVGSKTVLEILKEKHPATAPLHVESIIMDTPPTPPHLIQFEALTRQVIRRAALNTHGSAGPSGVDTDT